ncbi:MAG TPA: DUF5818 domain-containing protein [Terriglobales bacterium]|nr:DUF5818 domain-containing protein [Terriglobales bacterium]
MCGDVARVVAVEGACGARTAGGSRKADGATAQNAPTANQGTDIGTAQKTFTGVITKSGDKAVLTDPLTRTSYQLDDQRKAQGMVNKNVKVTGVLDPSTGTIRVTAIDSL